MMEERRRRWGEGRTFRHSGDRLEDGFWKIRLDLKVRMVDEERLDLFSSLRSVKGKECMSVIASPDRGALRE
jgi:hypothetical protein